MVELIDEAEGAAAQEGAVLVGKAAAVAALDEDRAAIRPLQQAGDMQHRRFAGARRPDQRDDLAGREPAGGGQRGHTPTPRERRHRRKSAASGGGAGRRPGKAPPPPPPPPPPRRPRETREKKKKPPTKSRATHKNPNTRGHLSFL